MIPAEKPDFEELFELHYEEIKRFFFWKLGNYHDAEDATAEVFERALKGYGNYQLKPGVPTIAWLRVIAARVLIGLFRRNGKRESCDLEFSDQIEDCRAPDPALEVERRHTFNELWVAVEELSEKYRQVITLRFASHNELSHAETARVIDEDVGVVRVRQHRAIKELRKVLIRA